MLWQRFLYDNLNLRDSWFPPTNHTNYTKPFSISSRQFACFVGCTSEQETKLDAASCTTLKSGALALPALFTKTRAFFTLIFVAEFFRRTRRARGSDNPPHV